MWRRSVSSYENSRMHQTRPRFRDARQDRPGRQIARRSGRQVHPQSLRRVRRRGGAAAQGESRDGRCRGHRARPPGRAGLPTERGLTEPRYPALKGIMAAKKKPLDVKPTAPGPGALEILSLALPPERQAGKIVGEGSAAVPELVRLLREEAKVL